MTLLGRRYRLRQDKVEVGYGTVPKGTTGLLVFEDKEGHYVWLHLDHHEPVLYNVFNQLGFGLGDWIALRDAGRVETMESFTTAKVMEQLCEPLGMRSLGGLTTIDAAHEVMGLLDEDAMCRAVAQDEYMPFCALEEPMGTGALLTALGVGGEAAQAGQLSAFLSDVIVLVDVMMRSACGIVSGRKISKPEQV